jgi:hypothetical protein
MPILTTTPVLVASAGPGANDALAAGMSARHALWRVKAMQSELDRRQSRPAPQDPQHQQNAAANLASYRTRYAAVVTEAVDLAAQYAAQVEHLRSCAPATAEAVEHAIGSLRSET